MADRLHNADEAADDVPLNARSGSWHSPHQRGSNTPIFRAFSRIPLFSRLSTTTTRVLLYSAAAAALLACYSVYICHELPWLHPAPSKVVNTPAPRTQIVSQGFWSFDPLLHARDHGLSDAQCQIAFPLLYQEIERAKLWHLEHHPDGISESDIEINNNKSQLRLMIYDGQLRILNDWAIENHRRLPSPALRTLLSIHRAVSSVRDPSWIPDIEFTIDTSTDSCRGHGDKTVWSYCRERDDPGQWLMPGYATEGPYDEFRARVTEIEQAGGFRDKLSLLIWRGSPDHEPHDKQITSGLRKAANGQKWADVDNWHESSHKFDLAGHCSYKFAANTEGKTWSDQLRCLLNCNNVVISHELDWVAHYHPLLISSGRGQNIVNVRRDFSDLASAMKHLLDHPVETEQIAKNAAQQLRDRYLTPAAESCYWRYLFMSWRQVQGFEPRVWSTETGENKVGPPTWKGMAFSV